MTAPKRLSIKLFASNPQAIQAANVGPIFQRWIQQHAVAGLLIDVADYKHVHTDPGIVLIAHEGDYAYDFAEGRPGVQYTLKQPASNLNEALTIALERVVDAAAKLQQETDANGLQFDLSEIRIALLDRLNYPNRPDVQAALSASLVAFGEHILGQPVTVTVADEDSRAPLSFALRAETSISADTLRERLAAVVAG